MHREFGNSAYLEAAHRLLGFVCWTQEIKGKVASLSGGSAGRIHLPASMADGAC